MRVCCGQKTEEEEVLQGAYEEEVRDVLREEGVFYPSGWFAAAATAHGVPFDGARTVTGAYLPSGY